MRLLSATPETNNDRDDVVDIDDNLDDAAILAAFWNEVGSRLQYHYPELENDEIQNRVTQLLLGTHDAVVAKLGSHRVDPDDDAAIMRSLRVACAEMFAAP